ncbi:MAG: metallophosphatase family protein [Chloroflexota bacterium]|nr:metallophosphatase family protein [Chloroflexota bacterium]
MRIAVLSDIHSNLPALEAVMRDMERIDQVWVLGDVVGYGPHPNQVIAALQSVGARTVLGNHDGAAIGTVDPKDFNPDAGRAIAWTGTAIDDNARSYLSALPEVRTDGDLTAVHGSPRDPIWEYVTSSQIAALNFKAFETRVCFFGHTHLPVVFRLDDDTVRTVQVTPGQPVELDSKRCLINPGSVGQPRDGDPKSSYLVLDTEQATLDYRRVAYDVEATQRAMRDVGLPPRLVERLSYGR